MELLYYVKAKKPEQHTNGLLTAFGEVQKYDKKEARKKARMFDGDIIPVPATTPFKIQEKPYQGMNNQERAEHAGAAVTEYLSSKGEPHDESAEQYEISDLICDLLHHGSGLGFSWEKIIETAMLNFHAEKDDDKTPVFYRLKNHGCAVAVVNGTLFEVVINADNTLDKDDEGNLNYGEVTAPESQEFLDDVNERFSTKYKLENFAGR